MRKSAKINKSGGRGLTNGAVEMRSKPRFPQRAPPGSGNLPPAHLTTQPRGIQRIRLSTWQVYQAQVRADEETRRIHELRERAKHAMIAAGFNPFNADEDVFDGFNHFNDTFNDVDLDDDYEDAWDRIVEEPASNLMAAYGITDSRKAKRIFGFLTGNLKVRVSQSRAQRRQNAELSWQRVLPSLIRPYLEWSQQRSTVPAAADADRSTLLPNVELTREAHDIKIKGVHYNVDCPNDITIHVAKGEDVNVALMRHGYIGGTPVTPSVAFHLDLLRYAHSARKKMPGSGMQGILRAQCDFHNIHYTQGLQLNFRQAFDIYLEVLKRADALVDAVLGRSVDFHVKNGCGACDNKAADATFPGEIPKPDGMFAMDGCDSHKRMKAAGRADQREFNSPFFAAREFVNRYQNEVRDTAARRKADAASRRAAKKGKGKPKAAATAPAPASATTPASTTAAGAVPSSSSTGATSSAAQNAEENDIDEVEVEVDEAGFVRLDYDPCADTWKAANGKEMPPATKEALEQSGIYILVCRHGVVKLVIEMVQSGELAKYALAAIRFVLDNYGSDIVVGYDIGCVLEGTLRRSSFGPEALDEKRIRIVVDAFHCWAHKRTCQLNYHPIYKPELGIEDLSISERIFSVLNACARITRNMSNYRWKQAMDMHIRQSNEDRYAASGNFLLQNVKQSLGIIFENTAAVAKFMREVPVTEDQLRSWIDKERVFLRDATKKEPELTTLHVEYVKTLEKLWANELKEKEAAAKAADTTLGAYDRRSAPRELARAQQAVNRTLTSLHHWEDVLKISPGQSWTPESELYKETAIYMARKEFVRAAEAVRGLVIARMMEMEKLHAIGLGYKLRNHVSASLGRRSKALKNAIDSYNKLAPKYKAPRVEYEDVVKMTDIAAFDRIIAGTQDLEAEAWAKAEHHEAANKWWKLEGARVELKRCYVEIWRLHHWVDSEDRDMADAINRLQLTDAPLAAYLDRIRHRRAAINDGIRKRLEEIYKIPGYAGPQPAASRAIPAKRKAADSLLPETPAGEQQQRGEQQGAGGEEDSDSDEDEDPQGVERLAEIILPQLDG
ncbi:unnamed protein product [Peniophora sp. CBMAI 1063]|nr:unnamed protein product [Peniophora sp. CBMAI 1063]